MIFALLKSYGKVLTALEAIKDFSGISAERRVAPAKIQEESTIGVKQEESTADTNQSPNKAVLSKVDASNDVLMRALLLRKAREPNYLGINSQRTFQYQLKYEAALEHKVFNYSIQKNSTTSSQLEKLRHNLHKVTYSNRRTKRII